MNFSAVLCCAVFGRGGEKEEANKTSIYYNYRNWRFLLLSSPPSNTTV
jgi:hypothetical protein